MAPEQRALQDDYVFSLEAFEGPLDLLLFLIRRAEVDIQDIPIAEITDQYLLVLQQVDDVDIEQAGDFLVMAATLIELKSRTLAPVEEGGELDDAGGEGPEDPRQDLIRQLLSYQRIRAAGEQLEDRRESFARRLRVRIRPSEEALKLDECIEMDDVHLMDLVDSWERIAAAINFDRLGSHHVSVDDAPIALYQADLIDRLGRRAGAPLVLQETFAGKSMAQRIGLFLAVLELVKGRRVRCRQDDWGEPIELEINPDWDETTAVDLDSEFDSPSVDVAESASDVPSPTPSATAQPPMPSTPATDQAEAPSD